MTDRIDLGPTPSEEDCAQVGRPDYDQVARRESQAYLRQLRRVLGDEPDGARLSVTSDPHDFGRYWSVVCYFDDQHPASADYAFRCEREGPTEWDEEARRELAGPSAPVPSPQPEGS